MPRWTQDPSCRESDCRAYWLGRNHRILDWLLDERSSIICLQVVFLVLSSAVLIGANPDWGGRGDFYAGIDALKMALSFFFFNFWVLHFEMSAGVLGRQ